ncbi:MAG TPA: hypothetical protein VK636_18140 [Gemmatimonadaceae bacterium]|nr:hypothetical protein [Gemmatimonadaceae bacterium]
MATNSKNSASAEKREVWEDPIVAEVRAVRDKIAAQFDYDIGRIFDHFASLDKGRSKTAAKKKPAGRKGKAKAK